MIFRAQKAWWSHFIKIYLTVKNRFWGAEVGDNKTNEPGDEEELEKEKEEEYEKEITLSETLVMADTRKM